MLSADSISKHRSHWARVRQLLTFRTADFWIAPTTAKKQHVKDDWVVCSHEGLGSGATPGGIPVHRKEVGTLVIVSYRQVTNEGCSKSLTILDIGQYYWHMRLFVVRVLDTGSTF